MGGWTICKCGGGEREGWTGEEGMKMVEYGGNLLGVE